MKIYISGQITGINIKVARAKFEEAERKIKEAGHSSVNPMKLHNEDGLSWRDYMKKDIGALMGCDAIYMISGWVKSKGATIEYQLAVKLDYEFYVI